jgi:hypothetical protein
MTALFFYKYEEFIEDRKTLVLMQLSIRQALPVRYPTALEITKARTSGGKRGRLIG